uniref:Uncharacterized protein n=1 Tax=Anguilla anguilla TaxID=7936 RepID=A0A0E9PNR2_ANGAN
MRLKLTVSLMWFGSIFQWQVLCLGFNARFYNVKLDNMQYFPFQNELAA